MSSSTATEDVPLLIDHQPAAAMASVIAVAVMPLAGLRAWAVTFLIGTIARLGSLIPICAARR